MLLLLSDRTFPLGPILSAAQRLCWFGSDSQRLSEATLRVLNASTTISIRTSAVRILFRMGRLKRRHDDIYCKYVDKVQIFCQTFGLRRGFRPSNVQLRDFTREMTATSRQTLFCWQIFPKQKWKYLSDLSHQQSTVGTASLASWSGCQVCGVEQHAAYLIK